MLDEETVIIPDGSGILLGAKILKIKMAQTIPGVEFCAEMVVIFEKNSRLRKWKEL